MVPAHKSEERVTPDPFKANTILRVPKQLDDEVPGIRADIDIRGKGEAALKWVYERAVNSLD